MQNEFSPKLKNGQCVFGTMVRLVSDPGIANMLVNAGFDFMFIDMEHSVFSLETVSASIRTARNCGIEAFVRPPGLVKPYISRLLDAGANGLMIPMTETQEQAEAIRDACYYRPIGKRGCAGLLGQTDYREMDPQEILTYANDRITIIAQVESVAGVENIESIVSTDGIKAVVIGPYDLSNSLGMIGRINDPAVTEQIEKVVQACRKYHKLSGIHTGSLEQLKYWKERGMQLLALHTDVNALYDSYKQYMRNLKSLL